jgi:hypothetical protein
MKLKYWNNGQPLQAFVKGSGNKASLRMSPTVVRMGKITSSPDDDLYLFEDTSVRPQEFQRVAGAPILNNDGWTISSARGVEYIELDIIKRIKSERAQTEVSALLAKDDWQTIRELEEPGKPMDQSLKMWRAALRQESTDFEIELAAALTLNAVLDLEPVWSADPREIV